MMASQISFYILSPQKRLKTFVCQLIQTVLEKSDDSIIVVAALDLLHSLDDRLWSFSEVSFVPHQIIRQVDAFSDQKIPACVVLTDNIELVTKFDGIVINLTNEPILDTQANRILEVIDAEPEHVESGRQKYRIYQASLQSLLATSPTPIQVYQIP